MAGVAGDDKGAPGDRNHRPGDRTSSGPQVSRGFGGDAGSVREDAGGFGDDPGSVRGDAGGFGDDAGLVRDDRGGLGDDPDDLAALAAAGTALAEAVETALPGWVETCVTRLAVAHQGTIADELVAAAAGAGQTAAAEVGAQLRALLATDVDEQRTNPLAVLRGAVRYPTAVLEAAGVPPVVRGEFEERAFPADVYDLAPATWSDLDPSLQEPGIVWGAAKAHVVLARRRREGKR